MCGTKIAHLSVKAAILSRAGMKGPGKKNIYSFNLMKYLQRRDILMETYYKPEHLTRFQEIGKEASGLAEKFSYYYNSAFGGGELTERGNRR